MSINKYLFAKLVILYVHENYKPMTLINHESYWNYPVYFVLHFIEK